MKIDDTIKQSEEYKKILDDEIRFEEAIHSIRTQRRMRMIHISDATINNFIMAAVLFVLYLIISYCEKFMDKR